LKLYCFMIAPNPTKVRLYLAEKAHGGHPLDVAEVTVNLAEGEQGQPAHLARNPFGSLPVLELDDGRVLIESLSIIEYLEELHPQPPMIGGEPYERALVKQLERRAEFGVLNNVARLVHATNSPLGLPPNPEVARLCREDLPRNLAYFDAVLSDGRPFVAGERPTIADCTLAAALQFGRFGKVDAAEGHEHVERWQASYRERPPAKGVILA